MRPDGSTVPASWLTGFPLDLRVRLAKAATDSKVVVVSLGSEEDDDESSPGGASLSSSSSSSSSFSGCTLAASEDGPFLQGQVEVEVDPASGLAAADFYLKCSRPTTGRAPPRVVVATTAGSVLQTVSLPLKIGTYHTL